MNSTVSSLVRRRVPRRPSRPNDALSMRAGRRPDRPVGAHSGTISAGRRIVAALAATLVLMFGTVTPVSAATGDTVRCTTGPQRVGIGIYIRLSVMQNANHSAFWITAGYDARQSKTAKTWWIQQLALFGPAFNFAQITYRDSTGTYLALATPRVTKLNQKPFYGSTVTYVRATDGDFRKWLRIKCN